MEGVYSSVATPEREESPRRILVIDDEESLRHMLGVILSRAGYEVHAAADGEEGLAMIEADPEISIVLCDVRMPRLDGLGFLKGIGERRAQVHTIVMSAYGSMDLAYDAVRLGAYDYISKPFKAEEILLVLKKVEERERLHRERERLRLENAQLKARMRDSQGEGGIVGHSRPIQDLLETVRKVAAYPTTVLITGESGTGKELLARLLHDLSPRSDGPFVAVNCGAIPPTLLESELFGHERGAFTGAIKTRGGLFETADGGTLLLDELGELPVEVQVKLLRVLEMREVRRLGGSRDRKVDVRVVAATSRNLRAETKAGRFREDLLYRLNVVHCEVPPLRERREDIPLLIEHFLDTHSARLSRPRPEVDPEAMAILLNAHWPGNVRQLENALERALVLSDDVICASGLPAELAQDPPSDSPVLQIATGPSDDLSIKSRSAALERELIAEALRRTGGNRSQAAKLLELSYKALLYKIRDYGLSDKA